MFYTEAPRAPPPPHAPPPVSPTGLCRSVYPPHTNSHRARVLSGRVGATCHRSPIRYAANSVAKFSCKISYRPRSIDRLAHYQECDFRTSLILIGGREIFVLLISSNSGKIPLLVSNLTRIPRQPTRWDFKTMRRFYDTRFPPLMGPGGRFLADAA